MPRCGSQIVLCDVPVRFDTYKGCSHGCQYCFTQRNNDDMLDIRIDETASVLRRWISGKRSTETVWCDWGIPLHWGGLSDPFQPIERELRESYRCLEVFAETGYPFIVSTKGKLLTDPDYLDLLRRCNAVVQVSLVSPKYDAIEIGAPTYRERMDMLPALAENSKRLIIRAQPYLREAKADIIRALPEYKARGVHGIVLEGMKSLKKLPGFVKMGADFVYPTAALRGDLEEIRRAAHRAGLVFYCGENRLRSMGDELCCCGIEGLEGFRPNRANLNHALFGDDFGYTDRQREPGTGDAFRPLHQTTIASRVFRTNSYEQNFEMVLKDRNFLKIMGVEHGKKDR